MRIPANRFGAVLGTALSMRFAFAFAFVLMSIGCAQKKPAEKHYYDKTIQPLLTTFCVGNTSPCHQIDPATGSAFGNLDLSSFEALHKRPDVLRTYGSYPLPLLLLKAVPEASVDFPYRGGVVPSEIRHVGGKVFARDSDAFYELERWLRNGANRDGVAPEPTAKQGSGVCNTLVPSNRDLTVVNTNSAAYQSFVADVAPKLAQSCAFGTCHGSPQSDFYLTCGESDQQMRFNFLQAAGFVVSAPVAPEQSEILLRPLAPEAGGVSHTGGSFFLSREDGSWKAWKTWALAVQSDPANPADPVAAAAKTDGQKFFEARVMPKMLQRGCALEGCHSPDGFNDFRLRSGAQGFFAPLALKRNYENTLKEFMALDTVDVAQSRAVKKNLFLSEGGIAHRAGSLLEGPDAAVDPANAASGKITIDTCPTPFDPARVNQIPAFCVFVEWHRIERAARASALSPMAMSDVLPLAFVARPPDGDSLLQFDTFRGGSDLMVADATLGARGVVTSVTNARSVLGACAGLVAGTADVRGPEWSPDGQKLVFAARPAASGGLDLWMIDRAGGGGGTCRPLTSDNGRMMGQVKVHNFDP
ncbi:MAG: PD40 domain-containing protein, partial [Deltaproteobacteria bacterium]|nr:PD40 domain-containing protein [Deltaproteobacteria bacterium]